ncbi:MAG: ABC transporter substrate-binding protein, partial [Desulfobacteraceae bacterium]|nr:ABC transporter substrate-binding protein [Desulfobacteraceae bacterium]
GCEAPSRPEPVPPPPSKAIVMGSAVDLYTIDPAVGFDTAISSTLKSLYDTLFRHVGNPPEVVPWLAENYDVSDDYTRWRFMMDKEAVFHDGTPVTADAVKFSLERMLRIGKSPAGLFKGTIAPDGIKAIGEHILQIQLSKPIGFFLHLLPWLFVVNPTEVIANKGNDDARTWLKTHEAGSGPFTIDTWKPGKLYIFKAVDDYWKGWPNPDHPDRYERRVIKNTQDRIRAIESGLVDLVDWMPPDTQVRFKSTPGIRVVDEPGLDIFTLKMNNRTGYTADLHLRRAISYAFNYEALIGVWRGRADLLQGPLPQGLDESSRDLPAYRTDMIKAKAALAQSPWPTGGFDLDYVYVAGLAEERLVGEILGLQLAGLDIQVNIIPMAWADAVAIFRVPETSPPVFPIYSSSAYPDPNNYLWAAYHSSQAGEWTNPGHYQNPVVDRLLENARTSMDAKQRSRLYRQAQQIILDEAVNIFGVSIRDYHAFGQHITGMTYCPVMGSATPFYSARTTKHSSGVADEVDGQ